MDFDPASVAFWKADPSPPGARPRLDAEDDVRDAMSDAADALIAEPFSAQWQAYAHLVARGAGPEELEPLVRRVAIEHRDRLDRIFAAAGERQGPVQEPELMAVAEGLLACASANAVLADRVGARLRSGTTFLQHASERRDAAVAVVLGAPSLAPVAPLAPGVEAHQGVASIGERRGRRERRQHPSVAGPAVIAEMNAVAEHFDWSGEGAWLAGEASASGDRPRPDERIDRFRSAGARLLADDRRLVLAYRDAKLAAGARGTGSTVDALVAEIAKGYPELVLDAVGLDPSEPAFRRMAARSSLRPAAEGVLVAAVTLEQGGAEVTTPFPAPTWDALLDRCVADGAGDRPAVLPVPLVLE